jgi:hypothetical protein
MRSSDRFLRNVTILLGLACMVVGCGPSSLAFLFLPFVDDRIEPKCKLAKADKEIKIVIASRFQNIEVRPDLQPADRELADALASELRKRFKLNKEKAQIEPIQRVQPHLAKLKEWTAASLIPIGEQFQADYVIALEIEKMSLLMPSSFDSFYKGNADIHVRVYDVHQPAIDAELLRQSFHCEYPNVKTITPSDMNAAGFRALFNNRMARDLARWFTAYPSDEKFDID